jgi:hypothetical protein
MQKVIRLLAVFAVVCVPVGCGGDDDTESRSLTVVTDIDFSREPYKGTFEVTEGADALGCSSGKFVDKNVGEQDVEKVSICTEVPRQRSGTFTILFHPTGEEGDVSRWEFVRGTGDFAGIEGEGDFSVDYSDDEETGVETLTGDVRFD